MSVINNNKFAILGNLSEKKKTIVVSTNGAQHPKQKKEKNDHKDKTTPATTSATNSNKKGNNAATSAKAKKDTHVGGSTLTLLKAEARRSTQEHKIATEKAAAAASEEHLELPKDPVPETADVVDAAAVTVAEGGDEGEAKEAVVNGDGNAQDVLPVVVEEEKPEKIVKSMADFEAERRARAVFVQARPRTVVDVSNTRSEGGLMLAKPTGGSEQEIKVIIKKVDNTKNKKQAQPGKENTNPARGKGAKEVQTNKKAPAPEKISIADLLASDNATDKKKPYPASGGYKGSREGGYRPRPNTSGRTVAAKLDVNNESQFPSL